MSSRPDSLTQIGDAPNQLLIQFLKHFNMYDKTSFSLQEFTWKEVRPGSYLPRVKCNIFMACETFAAPRSPPPAAGCFGNTRSVGSRKGKVCISILIYEDLPQVLEQGIIQMNWSRAQRHFCIGSDVISFTTAHSHQPHHKQTNLQLVSITLFVVFECMLWKSLGTHNSAVHFMRPSGPC